jgi:peptidoglycan/LPS O-acetylase OafA/YrhL
MAGRFAPARRLLATPGIRIATASLAWVGLGSYAIYVLHYPLLYNLSQRSSGLAWTLTAIVLLILLAPFLETRLQDAFKRPQFGRWVSA